MSAAGTREFARAPSALAYMLRGAMPQGKRSFRDVTLTARWSGHRADRRQLASFLRLTGLPDAEALPLLYPHTFGFRLLMAILTDPSFPVPIWRVLQTRNHLLQHRPIPVDATLDIESRVASARGLDKGVEVDLHTRVHVDAVLAWESLVTFYARGVSAEKGAPSPLAPAPTGYGEAISTWTMPNGAHWRFGRMTGDYNGVHLFDWYASRFGFARALYHPPRVLGHCLAGLPALTRDVPQRLDAWLKGPVSRGARVRLHASATDGATVFALFAEDPRPSIVGRLGPVPAGTALLEDDGDVAGAHRQRKETER